MIFLTFWESLLLLLYPNVIVRVYATLKNGHEVLNMHFRIICLVFPFKTKHSKKNHKTAYVLEVK